MQAKHQSSSDPKATTVPAEGPQAARHLMAIRIVGTALFDYQVNKTPDARIRLDADPVHARIEDLALAQAARRGAGAEQQRRSQHKAANGMSQRIHCLSVVFRAGVSSAGRGP